MVTKKRNGEVDILRFVFALIVLLYHFCSLFGYKEFSKGFIGVEFFFIISGYLMARHAKYKDDNTFVFIKNKIKSFYPFFIGAVLFQVLHCIFIKDWGIELFINTIWQWISTVTLTFMLFPNAYNVAPGGTWYLSVMIISMALIYPLLRKWYKVTTRVILPILSIGIFAFLYVKFSMVSLVFQWTGFCRAALLRGIAEIGLGASFFALSEKLKNKFENNIEITIVKWAMYGYVFLYAYGFDPIKQYNLLAAIVCILASFLSIANFGYVIKGNKLTTYLGKISLPIYVYHGVFRWILYGMLKNYYVSDLMFIALMLGSIVVSILLMCIVEFGQKNVTFKAKIIRDSLLSVTKKDIGNVKIIALDADNTSSYDLTTTPIPGAARWIKKRKAEGYTVVLLSNAKASRAKILAEQYNIDAIGFSAKPLPLGGIRLLLKYKVRPSSVVMIGDQLLTDIIGGNLLGFKTIYTKPYQREKNRGKVFFFKRKIERFIFKLQGVKQ